MGGRQGFDIGMMVVGDQRNVNNEPNIAALLLPP